MFRYRAQFQNSHTNDERTVHTAAARLVQRHVAALEDKVGRSSTSTAACRSTGDADGASPNPLTRKDTLTAGAVISVMEMPVSVIMPNW